MFKVIFGASGAEKSTAVDGDVVETENKSTVVVEKPSGANEQIVDSDEKESTEEKEQHEEVEENGEESKKNDEETEENGEEAEKNDEETEENGEEAEKNDEETEQNDEEKQVDGETSEERETRLQMEQYYAEKYGKMHSSIPVVVAEENSGDDLSRARKLLQTTAPERSSDFLHKNKAATASLYAKRGPSMSNLFADARHSGIQIEDGVKINEYGMKRTFVSEKQRQRIEQEFKKQEFVEAKRLTKEQVGERQRVKDQWRQMTEEERAEARTVFYASFDAKEEDDEEEEIERKIEEESFEDQMRTIEEEARHSLFARQKFVPKK